MSNDSRIAGVLSKVTTATITTILLKKGLRNVWLRGARPLQARIFLGEALTPLTIAGTVIVVAGVYLANYKGRVSPEAIAAEGH